MTKTAASEDSPGVGWHVILIGPGDYVITIDAHGKKAPQPVNLDLYRPWNGYEASGLFIGKDFRFLVAVGGIFIGPLRRSIPPFIVVSLIVDRDSMSTGHQMRDRQTLDPAGP